MIKRLLLAALFALAYLNAANAAEKYVVQNGSPTPGVNNLDIYVAERLGFFAEEGLDVEVRYSQGAPQATQIAASGAADTARVSFEPYLSGYARGMRGKFYMRSPNHTVYWIAVPQDSDITSIEQLKGKKIGVTNLGSAAIFIARSTLRSAGIVPDSSTFVPVGAGASALQALKDGKVSALALWDAGFATLERVGGKLRHFYHPVIGKVGNSGFLMSDASIEKRREAHMKFIRALIKARYYISYNRKKSLEIYWDSVPGSKLGSTPEEQYANGIAEIEVSNTYPENADINAIGRFDFAELKLYLEAMKKEDVFQADLSPADVFSNALIDEMGKLDKEQILRKAAK